MLDKEYERRCEELVNDPSKIMDDKLLEDCPSGATKFQYGIFYEYIHKALVDTQVILQILVSKGIVTKEEVDELRDTVKKSPKYKEIENEQNRLQMAGMTELIQYKAMKDIINDRIK